MTDPKFAQAARELETYFKDQCGFDLGSLPSVPTTSG
jgi:hypothetical protein